MYKAIIAIVIATIVAIFAFTQIDPKIPNDSQISVVEGDYNSITVSGEVNKPGTYVMKEGDTIDDLIMEAGGPTSNADARAYFENTLLGAGVSYYIAPIKDLDDICGEVEYEKVNVNTDDRDTLMKVNGIGTAVASAIISYREANGSFTYLEELMKVSGIGNATFEKIKNYIILR
ncbi:MAG: ComEA family DNA-binding protein [Bacilli bacterium]|jgi:competence protein ComEA|nr:ComEA family DNA-binding protein [Bacilli bacterium]